MTRYIEADALTAAINTAMANSYNALADTVRTAITNAPTVTVTSPVPNGSLPGYRVSKSIVFNAPYSDTKSWTNGKTTAYPGTTPQTNPGDSKLDIISPSYTRPTDAGVFTATPSGTAGNSGKWATQLVTTEGSANAFQVKTGDVVACDFTPGPSGVVGAWPALWTWNGPSGEIDFFEYHSDNPNTAEFTNHVQGGVPNYPKIFTPGKTTHLEVVCGATSVQWWADGALVWEDKVGLPSTWRAYLIANLSVQAGNQYHPGPAAATQKIQATIANVTVYR